MSAPAPSPAADDEATRAERRRRLALPILPLGTVPQSYLQGLSGGFSVGTAGVFFASLVAATLVHLVVAAGAASVQLPQPKERIEMAIFEAEPPPPEPEPPPPEPEPEPEPPKPKPKPKEIKPPKEPPPKEVSPPPPSNQEPPPEPPSEPVPIVTGLSMSSVVENSGGPSMRVGNTTYGDPNKEKFVKPEEVRPYAGGSKEFKPTRVANLSKAARVRSEYRPRYPRALKEEGVEGVVVLRVQITSDGKSRKAKLVKGLHPVLDKLSLEAIKRFEWFPAEVDGDGVDSVLTYRMTWQLY